MLDQSFLSPPLPINLFILSKRRGSVGTTKKEDAHFTFLALLLPPEQFYLWS